MTTSLNLFINFPCCSISIILVAIVGVNLILLFLNIQEAAVSISPILKKKKYFYI